MQFSSELFASKTFLSSLVLLLYETIKRSLHTNVFIPNNAAYRTFLSRTAQQDLVKTAKQVSLHFYEKRKRMVPSPA